MSNLYSAGDKVFCPMIQHKASDEARIRDISSRVAHATTEPLHTIAVAVLTHLTDDPDPTLLEMR